MRGGLRLAENRDAGSLVRNRGLSVLVDFQEGRSVRGVALWRCSRKAYRSFGRSEKRLLSLWARVAAARERHLPVGIILKRRGFSGYRVGVGCGG